MSDGLWTYRARWTGHEVDADTIDVIVDHGMMIQSRQRIRLAGINAPEVRGVERAAGLRASMFVNGWLEEAASDEWPLLVTTQKDRRSFNRYVGDVVRVTDGSDLATDLAGFLASDLI